MRRLLAACLLFLGLGCRLPPAAIVTDQDFYTPAMSSTVGIGLSPADPSGGARCRWSTDYGTFLQWEPPDWKVVDLGPQAENGGKKIYWSYPAADASQPKQPVEIVLSMYDPTSGAQVSEARLHLRWRDRATAEVVR